MKLLVLNEFDALTDTHVQIFADTDLPCERNSVTVMPDHRKVIEEIMLAAPDGILLSELPQKFEVTIPVFVVGTQMLQSVSLCCYIDRIVILFSENLLLTTLNCLCSIFP